MRTKADGTVMTAAEELSACTGDITTILKEFGEKKVAMEAKELAWTEAREKELLELKNEIEGMRKAQAEFERKVKIPGAENAAKAFSLLKAGKAHFEGNWADCKEGLELINETHKAFNRDLVKDISAGVGTAGGFLLPVLVANEIIPLALASTPILNDLGIRRITDIAAGELRIPKATARASAQWVGEQGTPSSTSAAFEQRILRARKVAAVTFVSNDMARQGRPDMEAFCRQDLIDALGLKLEQGVLFGTGSDFQPKGLISNVTNAAQYSFSSATQIGANGGQFGFTQAAQMVNVIRKANLLKGALGYLFHPDVLYGLQITRAQHYQSQTADGSPIVPGSPLLTDEELTKILRGYKWATSTLVPNAATKGSGVTLAPTIFGDWSQVILGLWSGMELGASREATVNGTNAWAQDGFFLKAQQSVDVAMRDEAALTVISDCTTASLSVFPGT